MSDVVFILGAGASRQAGAPLMADFLDVANDLLNKRAVEPKQSEFERVFKTIGSLQSVHSKAQLDLNNIESIFTVLELGRVIRRIPQLEEEDIPLTIAALKEVIVHTLELTIQFPVRSGQIEAPEPYGEFGELVSYLGREAFPSQSVSIISFNYDIAADMGLLVSGVRLDYCLGDERVVNSIPLLKLHGSLNWATEKSTRSIIPVRLEEYFRRYQAFSSPASVRIGSQLTDYFARFESGRIIDNEPVIVPPSWNKADHHSALSNIWSAAAKHLSEATQIFVIGYSLAQTDSFFRHLYALGSVGASPLRRFAVFNPDKSGETDKRFKSLLGPGAAARYEYHIEEFAQAIETIKSFFPAPIRR
jgi:hypothetical protein